MASWLFAAELGSGLGHLTRLRRIADSLVSPRDEVWLAAPDLTDARLAFTGLSSHFLKTPPIQAVGLNREGSYAELLRVLGFASAPALAARSKAWRALIERAAPTALICDHAPFATFAARGRFPCAIIGGGFDLPPIDKPAFPPLDHADDQDDEDDLLKSARRVSKVLDQTSPVTIPGALSGDLRFLVGFPWLDPYEGRRNDPHWGPLDPPPSRTPCPVSGHVFAYLRPELPGFEALALALADLPMRRTVYIHNGHAQTAQLLRSRQVEVLDSPPDLTEILPTTTVVLGHAGAGLCSAAIFAGRPVVSVPPYREAAFNALALERLGMGRSVFADDSRHIYWAVLQAAEDLRMRDAALRVSRVAHQRFGKSPAPDIATRIRALAAKRKTRPLR